MTTTNGRPRDNLEAAQLAIAELIADAVLSDDLTLQIAVARALIDIARSLRSIEGYLCNTARSI